MKVFYFFSVVCLIFLVGCKQNNNQVQEKEKAEKSEIIQTQPSVKTIDSMSLDEVKNLPFDDAIKLYLSLDVCRIARVNNERDEYKQKLDKVFYRITDYSPLDKELNSPRKTGDTEWDVYNWKIKDRKTTIDVVQKTGLILLTCLTGPSNESIGFYSDIHVEQLFWILRASNSNHALPFLWLISNSDSPDYKGIAMMSLVAIRTRSSLYTAWKCYKNSYKLDALQMMTEKDWEYEKLSEWIGHNIHQISFDSEGKIYIDESWEYKNKLNQEFFLPDFDKKLGYVR